MWILWKMRFQNCEFCEKWDFRKVKKLGFSICEFLDKMWIFAPVCTFEVYMCSTQCVQLWASAYLLPPNFPFKAWKLGALKCMLRSVMWLASLTTFKTCNGEKRKGKKIRCIFRHNSMCVCKSMSKCSSQKKNPNIQSKLPPKLCDAPLKLCWEIWIFCVRQLNLDFVGHELQCVGGSDFLFWSSQMKMMIGQ